jgi:hypothetical protein
MNLSAIKEKLACLTSTDKDLKLFGAEKHQFVSKKVREYQIKWFEFKHRITLPSEYRAFLLEIGYGAGPHYGIHPLNKSIKWLKEWNEVFPGDFSLNNPFEFTTQDAIKFKQQNRENPESCFHHSLTHLNGILPICYEGCAYHTYLVISGEQRGYLWAYCEDDALTKPVGLSKQFSFLEWYNYWLDESIEEAKEKTA